MKFITSFILSMLFVSVVYAENPTKTNKGKTEPATKSTDTKATTAVKDVEEGFFSEQLKVEEIDIPTTTTPQEEITPIKEETDSSYYSVSKFNYLFYFIYKIQYLGEEEL